MGRRRRLPHSDVLTPREFEVLALLREGLSNPKIAGRLGISRDGVKYHVSEILGKLGLTSREEAARWSPAARPWWAAAAAPLALFARKSTAAIGLGLLAAAIGGVALLAVLLVRHPQDSSPVNTIGVPDTGYLTDMSLEMDNLGRPVVSYVQVPEGHLKVLHCGDPDCTAGNSITVPDDQALNGQTSLSLDGAGNPVVSYWGDDGRLGVLHCGDPDCTTGNSIATPETGRNTGQFSSLVLDRAGNPVVSYYDGHSFDLKILHCGNPNCTADNSIIAADTAGEAGWYSSLALDGAGNPVISYRGGLKILHCGNPNCTVGNSITSPDTGGSYTSLALDSTGNPVVSYWDWATSHLKVLHCADPNCVARHSIVEADRAGDVGNFSSLELDAAGNPVVSYVDNSSGRLKVLHCGSSDCNAGNSVTVPDRSPGLQYTSLALDAQGNPVVAYSDSSHEQLKVLHCADVSCSTAAAAASAASTAAAEAEPTPFPYTGIARVDRAIAMILNGRFDDLRDAVLANDRNCSLSDARCDAGLGTTFYAGCSNPSPTTLDDLTTLIGRTFARHAAWSLYAVAEDGPPGTDHNGYVLDVNVGTAPAAGVAVYLSHDGDLSGFDPCAMDVDPGLHYLYGPSFPGPLPSEPQ